MSRVDSSFKQGYFVLPGNGLIFVNDSSIDHEH